MLRTPGCDEGQGYYLDRPLTPEVMAERLAARPTEPTRGSAVPDLAVTRGGP